MSIPLRRNPCSRSPEPLFHFTEIPSAESLDLPPQAPDLLLTGFGLRGLRGPLPLLFTGSILITESVSAAKYPGYRAYRASTPVLVPFLRFPRFGQGDRRTGTS